MANHNRLTQSPIGWALFVAGAFCTAVATGTSDFVREMTNPGNLVAFAVFAALFATVPVALSGSTSGRQSAAALVKGLVPLTVILFMHAFSGLFMNAGEVWAMFAVLAFGASVIAARVRDTAELG